MGHEVEINGQKLKCSVCGEGQFSKRSSLLNTRGLTFLKLDWANQSADNYICEKCGYIMWFIQK
ncbi:MAG: hypothetical protein WCI27_00400 [Candidatus Omnitrophota bacterium]